MAEEESLRGLSLNPRKLINAVKKRSILYDSESPKYFCNKKARTRAWQEVSEEVLPNWQTLKPHEKVEHCLEVQKRWKSFRTCFRRELVHQKKEEEARKRNQPIKLRKIYGHYKQMSFMLPYYSNVKVTNEDSNSQEDNDSGDDDDDDDDGVEEGEGVNQEDTLPKPPTAEVAEVPAKIEDLLPKGNTTLINLDTAMLESVLVTDNGVKEEGEEDRQFLMSLLPTLKKFDLRQKLDARIQILKVLKDISFREAVGSTQ